MTDYREEGGKEGKKEQKDMDKQTNLLQENCEGKTKYKACYEVDKQSCICVRVCVCVCLQTFIVGVLRGLHDEGFSYRSGYWIGLSDQDTPGTYKWTTGSLPSRK